MLRRHNSEFRGKNKQKLVIPCVLIVYSLRFWDDTFTELAVYKGLKPRGRLLFNCEPAFPPGKSN